MKKNKKNLIIGLIGSGIMFMMGVLYLMFPTIYELDNFDVIDTNGLFYIFILVFSSIKLGEYFLIDTKDNKEIILTSIFSCLCGILNYVMNLYMESNKVRLTICLLVFILSIIGLKIFTFEYYKSKKDIFYYIEGICTLILFISGIVLSFLLNNITIIQTLALGFTLILLSILEAFNFTCKYVLSKPKLFGKMLI